MARDLEFEGLEDGDEVAEEVLVEVVTVDVFVVEVDVSSCPCRRTIVPTGIEKELPDSQQLVPFGPQQYVIVPASRFSPSGHGNKLLPNDASFAIIMAWRIPTGISATFDVEQVASAGVEAETVGKTKICPVAAGTDCCGRVACTGVEVGISLWVA